MSELLKKAKRGLTKAAHKAATASSLETSLDDFPPIPAIDSCSQLSIKVVDLAEVESAIRAFVFGKNTAFKPIRFLIRDDVHEKASVLDARLEPQRGFVLHQLNRPADDCLVVTLPTQSPSIIGKLQHPSGATLYKVQSTSQPDRWTINKASGNKAGGTQRNLDMVKVQKTTLQTLKAAQLLFDDSVFKIRANGTSLVKIRPKAKSDTNTYIVQFTEHCKVSHLLSVWS